MCCYAWRDGAVLSSLTYARTQRLATLAGGAFQHGDSQDSEYNTYGELSRRGINGLWQESFAYDDAGRLTATNAQDGVWRHFVHDRAGNRTATIESEGTDLSGKSLEQAVAIATAGGAHAIGGAYVDGINVTIGVFDKRGQQVATRMPHRQLSASATQSLVASRSYNAFGEVLSETDVRGNTTDFKYNTMGRTTERKGPAVDFTGTNGAVTAGVRPTETYFYDKSGRLVGTRDANLNHAQTSPVFSRILLAGTGYPSTSLGTGSEAEALVTAEFRPDGGVARTFYDRFGDARVLRNELHNSDSRVVNHATDEQRSYDAMGRLTEQVHRGPSTGSGQALTDFYAYDLLGERIRHWNSQLGTGNVETTDYDMQGRVTKTVAFGGDDRPCPSWKLLDTTCLREVSCGNGQNYIFRFRH